MRTEQTKPKVYEPLVAEAGGAEVHVSRVRQGQRRPQSRRCAENLPIHHLEWAPARLKLFADFTLQAELTRLGTNTDAC